MKDNQGSTYHHGSLKAALIDLGLAKLSKGTPLQKLSLRTLAAEVGVSKDAPRKHFPSSRDFEAALAAQGFRRLTTKLRSVESVDLSHIGVEYIRFVIANPQLYKTMFSLSAQDHPRYPDLQNAAGAAFNILERAVKPHLSQDSSLSPREGSLAAWSLVHGLSDLLVSGLIMSLDAWDTESLHRITRVLADGLTR